MAEESCTPPPGPLPPGIGLFDLDGTLLAWDCQLLFRHYVVRREPWRIVFLPIFLGLLPLYPLLKTAGMKRVFLSYLWGMPPAALAEYSRGFAEFVAPSAYPELLAEVRAHRERGDFLILASASPEFYVSRIGALLGFDLVLGTEVKTGPLFPDLENHKGAAKVARLHQLLPESYFRDGRLVNCHGYTDSTADLPMLALCDSATLVNPSPRLAAIGEERGWRIVRPRRPWSSRPGFYGRALRLLFGIGKDPGGITG